MKYLVGLVCIILIGVAMFSFSSRSAPTRGDSELITTRMSQADIDWLRSADVNWIDCEARAPMIEPHRASPRGEKRLGALLPVFFLHARFEPGIYDIGASQPFAVTRDHLTLLKTASWRGSAIDCKRPYGDFTNFTIDMASALGLPVTAGADRIARISPQDEERMEALHDEMLHVVAAYLRHGVLEPGAYRSPRGGLEPIGAARPRLVPPGEKDFLTFLRDMRDTQKAKDSWHAYSVIAELYSAP
jgi:hypothetical protein